MIHPATSTIVHMDLDCFFVSVSRMLHPQLRGKPVIVGGGERGVVAACSYETRVFGVHSAMPIKMAKRLCPDAIIVRGDYDQYSKKSDEVTQIISERVPLFERSSIDEFYIDMSGMDQYFGSYKYATELRQRIIKETGLPISFGMSKNKTVSKIATDEVKPNNQMMVEYGTEKDFLAPLSVKKIPMVGEKTYQLLRSMGIEKVRTIQQMPMQLFDNVMGDNGVSLWRKANAIDNSPVEPYNEQKSMSQEETFDTDTIDVTRLRHVLIAMVEKLCFRLRTDNKLTSCITVKIRYSNFDTHTMQCRIPYTSNDHTLIARVKELFEKLYNRRLLIRLVGVKLSHLVNGGHQIDMFEDSIAVLNLYQAMDKLRLMYGEDKVMRAVSMNHSLRGFNPFNGLSSSPAAVQQDSDGVRAHIPSLKSMNKLLGIKKFGQGDKADAPRAVSYEYKIVISVPPQVKRYTRVLQNNLNALMPDEPPQQHLPRIALAQFLLNDVDEEQLIQHIQQVTQHHAAIAVSIKDFVQHNGQGLYMHVPANPALQQLLRSLRATLCLPPSKCMYMSRFDIAVITKFTDALNNKVQQQLPHKKYEADFLCHTIALLRRGQALAPYETVAEFVMGVY